LAAVLARQFSAIVDTQPGDSFFSVDATKNDAGAGDRMTKHTDPRREAIWQATPIAYRYILAGIRHIELTRGEHRSLVSLDNLTEEEIERLC
jgi:hypothetical protein